MQIIRVPNEHKRDYRNLLLLADEQWSMVERYLDCSDMWAMEEDGAVCAECVVANEGDGVLEVKNLAVDPAFQRRGLGRALLDYVRRTYAGKFERLRICTGDSPLTVPFYESCGFTIVDRQPGYFNEHYDHPIYEAGKLLTDMVVMEWTETAHSYLV